MTLCYKFKILIYFITILQVITNKSVTCHYKNISNFNHPRVISSSSKSRNIYTVILMAGSITDGSTKGNVLSCTAVFYFKTGID